MKQVEVIYSLGLTCPYCGDQYRGRIGCCGESYQHGEEAYLVKFEDGSDDHVLESELEVEP